MQFWTKHYKLQLLDTYLIKTRFPLTSSCTRLAFVNDIFMRPYTEWMNEWMNDITVLRIEESLLYNSITHHKKLKRLQLILLTISFQQNQTLVKNISKYKKPKLSLFYFHLFWTTLVRLHARTAAAIPNMNKKQAACSLWKLKTLKWKRQDTQSTGQR